MVKIIAIKNPIMIQIIIMEFDSEESLLEAIKYLSSSRLYYIDIFPTFEGECI